MFEYAHLEALVAVVREGSFERAARALHVTPSALSQRIKLLEERLGMLVVVRGQPCRATPMGAALCRHAELVALMEDEVRQSLPGLSKAEDGDRPRPTFHIAVNADSLATWFMPVLNDRFKEEGALFEVEIDDQDHTATLLRQGGLQAAVTASSQPVQGCRLQPLGRMRYLATCSPDFHRAFFSGRVDRHSLAKAPRLVFGRKDALQTHYIRKITRQEVEGPTHLLPNVHAFVDACMGGIGWGMNPESMVRHHLASGALVQLAKGRFVDVPLYWQQWRSAPAALERLSQSVLQQARRSLRQG
jgi:LysR family transcriptional regulator (chromosome initiation inhibitor)